MKKLLAGLALSAVLAAGTMSVATPASAADVHLMVGGGHHHGWHHHSWHRSWHHHYWHHHH